MKKPNYKIVKKFHYELETKDQTWVKYLDESKFLSFESLCEEIVYKVMFDNKKFSNIHFENTAECEYFEAVRARYVRLLKNTIKPIEIEDDGQKSFSDIEIKIGLILRNDWNPIGFGAILPNDEYDSYIPRIYQLLSENAEQKMIEACLEHIETTVIGLTRNKKNEASLILLTQKIAKKLCTLKKDILK